MKLNLARFVWGIIPVAVSLSTTAHADLLYWNFATDLGTRFNPGPYEIGDEIILAAAPPGRAYVITNFSFNYWASNLSASAQMQVRFYRNDGPAYGSTARVPGTVLFDSGRFPIASTDRSMLIFDTDFGAGLKVPRNFTWTVQYFELGEGGSAGVGGVDLFGPPTVGQNYPDYWLRTGPKAWELAELTDVNVDFAAAVEGVTVAQPDSVLYWNFATDLETRLNSGTSEIGDEIVLAGAPPGQAYVITNFSFNYWASNLIDGARMQVRFYRNDGPAYGSTAHAPGTLLFDSGAFPIASTDRSMLIFDTDFGAGLAVPRSFTWTVQFYRLGTGGSAGVGGVDLFGPPTVGQNYPDYWRRIGPNAWQLAELAGVNVDFAAGVEGNIVPELVYTYNYSARTMTLSWNGADFALEWAVSLGGPWTTINIPSPVTVWALPKMMFFRLHKP